MSHETTRRDFIKQSTAVGAAWWVGTQSAFALSKSPLERINFACIEPVMNRILIYTPQGDSLDLPCMSRHFPCCVMQFGQVLYRPE
ncbi:MAG: twin-arginine translocation signal domain-containing protein [Planctomycetes bacterium]|nr:twin-arginine translocation signal domain-containing protein [Planctomycetota bacterium]